jgi:hypothetical protein
MNNKTMGTFKFTYDDENLKEIRVVCEGGEDMLDTIKTFCIDSIPEELEHEVEMVNDGYLIKSEEYGEEVLTHIFKYVYLVTRMAMIFKEDLEKKTDVENLDLSLLRSDIEKVANMDYHELAKLIGEIDDVAKVEE